MSYEYSENELVQRSAGEFLAGELGWEVALAYNREQLGVDGTFGRRSYREIVLERYFVQALRRLNPWMTDKQVQEALTAMLAHEVSDSALQTNEKKYELLRNGIKVQEVDAEGRTTERTARVIDYEHAENNHFLALKELKIHGEVYRRRTDIVGFVNGIPVLFIELKKQGVDVQDAYTHNYTDYQDTIPQLFYYNAFVVFSNGLQTKIGTLGSKYEFFHEWKRLKEEDVGCVSLETLLRGVCRKENLLDLLENFILFDKSTGRTAKILARNHQYLGVNEAVKAYAERGMREGKLGVFWHTQGSGKSYSMVFLAQKIRRKFAGTPTIVVLTDREELNKQISGTFAGCGLLGEADPKSYMAQSGNDLHDRLTGNPGFIFTLIQKFNRSRKPIQVDHDILIMSDEAHRSQYGIFAENMCRMLPTASRIGFTGTPIFAADNITERTFGDYVSVYDFSRAVEDGATVPLYYENRGEKIKTLRNPELTDEIIAAVEAADADEALRARLEQDFKREIYLLRTEPRMRLIAEDFVRHYTQLWTTGKAMFVCLDKVSCVMMHNYVQEYWQQEMQRLAAETEACADQQEALELQRKLRWMRETEMAVVISQEQNEVRTFKQWGLDIAPHRRKMEERELDKEFKDADSPFRIVFVCAMWMTGFDVKSLSCLYLDKPMKAHSLMQAIARANRVSEGKSNGLVTDYIGIVRALRKALADYTVQRGKQGGGADPTIDRDALVARIRELLKTCGAFLEREGLSLAGLIQAEGFTRLHELEAMANTLLADTRKAKELTVYVNDLLRLVKYTLRGELTDAELDEVQALRALRDMLKPNPPDKDVTDLRVQIYHIMNRHVRMEARPDGTDAPRRMDISKINFEKLSREFESSQRKFLIIRDLEAVLAQRLADMLSVNASAARVKYYEHFCHLIERYNEAQDRATIEQVFDELLQLSEQLTKEETRYVRMGFSSDEELALYDLLFEQNLDKEEIEQLKKASSLLLKRVKEQIAKLHRWYEKDTTIALVRDTISEVLYEGLPASYPDSVLSSYEDQIYEYVLSHYKVIGGPASAGDDEERHRPANFSSSMPETYSEIEEVLLNAAERDN